jgi:hypothetical protein
MRKRLPEEKQMIGCCREHEESQICVACPELNPMPLAVQNAQSLTRIAHALEGISETLRFILNEIPGRLE